MEKIRGSMQEIILGKQLRSVIAPPLGTDCLRSWLQGVMNGKELAPLQFPSSIFALRNKDVIRGEKLRKFS